MFSKFRIFSLIMIVILLITGISSIAFALYPERPIEIVVPWGPGGTSDTTARVVAKYFNKYSPQPMVIINIAGASGTTGRREVKNAKSDGYKLGIFHRALLIAKYTGLVDWGYEEFTPVVAVGNVPSALVCSIKAPWDNLQDLVEDAKERPGEISYNATPGGSSHFELLSLEEDLGITFNMVASGGDAERRASLYGGHIDLASLDIAAAKSYIESGDFKALAAHSHPSYPNERNPFMPDVPTFEEQGGKAYMSLLGYFGPKGLPDEVIQTLENIFTKVVQDEEFQEDFLKSCRCLNFIEHEEFTKYLEEADKTIAQQAKRAGF